MRLGRPGTTDENDPSRRVSPALWVISFKWAAMMTPLWAVIMVPSLGLGRSLVVSVLGIVPVALFFRGVCEVFVWRMGRPRTLGEMREMREMREMQAERRRGVSHYR